MTCPDHGTRARYQLGCPCVCCLRAEAQYRADLRRRKAKGLPILGATMSGAAAWKRIEQLKTDGLTRPAIATRLGWKKLRRVGHTDRMRVRNVLKLHRLVRQFLAEGPDAPLNSLNI